MFLQFIAERAWLPVLKKYLLSTVMSMSEYIHVQAFSFRNSL